MKTPTKQQLQVMLDAKEKICDEWADKYQQLANDFDIAIRNLSLCESKVKRQDELLDQLRTKADKERVRLNSRLSCISMIIESHLLTHHNTGTDEKVIYDGALGRGIEEITTEEVRFLRYIRDRIMADVEVPF
ncbi:hypothetical protein VN12_19800 [Pirellula sp. SH-Sr6A]|uniref:hypothetical protein n=1 Tax=Pirellula sp. SH-Sr6A TaxID=1632865 RepID=UPI00078EEA27|nr:hypothetical protein [Pirellula sp. SH-Sr6A]AMV30857.1 hypothetical protein VN12_01990 [Pirellula sp. SH-Sr6A]AMV34379.1 hypothetical protein VN12_19800 [Pirellula sp. SH-Sr6A]